MEGTYADDVTKLGLTVWIEDLARAHNDFQTLFTQRNTELASRPGESMREVRRKLDIVYRAMIKMIESYIRINGEKGYVDFINELNKLITYFKDHDHHHAKIDIKDAVVATIQDQVYEGEPVIVLPKVSYGGKKLVFATDYEVTYKDNDRVGTAFLSIHGKGAYKGTSITRFNIVEPLED
jgi:hypothetical protein